MDSPVYCQSMDGGTPDVETNVSSAGTQLTCCQIERTPTSDVSSGRSARFSGKFTGWRFNFFLFAVPAVTSAKTESRFVVLCVVGWQLHGDLPSNALLGLQHTMLEGHNVSTWKMPFIISPVRMPSAGGLTNLASGLFVVCKQRQWQTSRVNGDSN